MYIEIEFEAQHLHQIMDAVRREVSQPSGILESVGQTLETINRQRHKRGVDPNEKPWQPLSPRTLSANIKRVGGPLKRTGRMLNDSFTYQLQGNSVRIGFDGNDAKQAIYHQFGAAARQSKKHSKVLEYAKSVGSGLPMRQLLGFTDSDKKAVVNATADHLNLILAHARNR